MSIVLEWNDTEIVSVNSNNNLFLADIEIFLWDDNKHYARNKDWKLVFLKKWLYPWTKSFYFDKIDWNNVLVAEQDWVNYYFLENGEQYFPEDKVNKLITSVKEFIYGLSIYFR